MKNKWNLDHLAYFNDAGKQFKSYPPYKVAFIPLTDDNARTVHAVIVPKLGTEYEAWATEHDAARAWPSADTDEVTG